MCDCVAILMAVYNGSDYLNQQINSIIGQSYPHWRLFVRDDGSIDDSVDIIRRYSDADDRICLIEDPSLIGGGSKENFAAIYQYLMTHDSFKYYMFSDQDDVWLPNKIEKSLAACKAIEESFSGPVLVHTDLEVVDAELNTLGSSFVSYRALDPGIKDFNHLLVQNNVTGCTALWNKRLNEILNLGDSSIAMHDWWMALVASAFGKISFVDEALIKYRQHEKNVVGATDVNSIQFILKRLAGLNHVRDTFRLSFEQASLFASMFKSELTEEQLNTVLLFCSVERMTKLDRISTLIRHGFLKQGFVQVIGELLFI